MNITTKQCMIISAVVAIPTFVLLQYFGNSKNTAVSIVENISYSVSGAGAAYFVYYLLTKNKKQGKG